MRIAQALAAITLAVGLSGQVLAAPVFYTNAASFAADASGIPLSTENLDTTPIGLFPRLTPSGINITGVNVGTSRVDTAIYGTDRVVRLFTRPGGSSVTYSFPDPISAFGVDVYDLATVGTTTVTLSNSNGDSAMYVFPDSPNGNQRFFGIIDLMDTYNSVTFTNSDGGDYVEFDNIQYGVAAAVPEPASLALWGLGLAAFGVWRRRRS